MTCRHSAGPHGHEAEVKEEFEATLQKSPSKGGWTYVIWRGRRSTSTHGLVSVAGTIDGEPFRSSFMARDDGTHKLPMNAEVSRQIGKGVGDTSQSHCSSGSGA